MGYVDATSSDDHSHQRMAVKRDGRERQLRLLRDQPSFEDRAFHRESTYNGSPEALRRLKRRRIRP